MELFVKNFNELLPGELYGIFKLRQDVFIIEQNCIYPDIDELDLVSSHVFALDENKQVCACLRVFWKKDEAGVVQIGRVVTKNRGVGLGLSILHRAVEEAKKMDGAREAFLEAQTYATGFYQKEGFEICSGEFLEDGIPHVQMRLLF